MTVDVAGHETTDVAVAADATYADLLADLPYRPAEVAILVDGRPVPADAPVETDRVRVVRLVTGG